VNHSSVAPLFEGKLDIVGDIHGEIEALDALLTVLGYGPDGEHAQGRRLVFVGDLVDRGPDSPAVVERVMKLVPARSAGVRVVRGLGERLNCLEGNRNPDGPEEVLKPPFCPPSPSGS
jgi:hypothetical protein